MTAEIVSIGTELLLGQIANTDAQFLSRELAAAGLDVYRHTAVGDNLDRVVEALQAALSRCDVVVTTGGLGPTTDDLTKPGVARALGLPMVFDPTAMRAIETRFAQLGRRMPESNRQQAAFPQGAVVLPNACGTAPGCWIQQNSKTILVLPGPPHELADMYVKQARARVAALTGEVIVSRVLRVFGMGESAMEEAVADLLAAQTNPSIAPLLGPGDVTLRVTAKAKDEAAALALIAPVESALRQRLGDAVYAVTEDDLCLHTAKLSIQKKATLAVAESLTGGILAGKLVKIPGISAVFYGGIVAYDNRAKVDILGVPQAILDTHGAVSQPCAQAMAEGMLRLSGTDFALATTGIAGPGGQTPDKPVGLVYIALARQDGETQTQRLELTGGRERIRQMTCVYAMNLLRLALQNP